MEKEDDTVGDLEPVYNAETERELYAAEQGNAKAQYRIGRLFEHDGDGVPKNLSKAREWYLKAAEQGHGLAQLETGNMMERGQGGAKQISAEILEWNLKAVRQIARAQFHVGAHCAHRKDGVRDYATVME